MSKVSRLGESLVCCVLLFATTHSQAESFDVVRIRNSTGKGEQAIRGEILQYDERGLKLKIPNRREPMFYEPEQVIGVTTTYTPPHIEADRLLERKDFVNAASQYAKALEVEPRNWAKTRIRSTLISCYKRGGDWEKAANEFFKLAESRDDPELMAIAPLFWPPNAEPTAAQKMIAERWLLDSSNAMMQLVASSWLLATDQKKKVIPILEKLMTESELRVSFMARAQRMRIPDKPPTKQDIERYRQLIDRMPEPIRAGPMYSLGLAYEREGNFAEAALAFLWVPFVYDRNSELSGDALFRAATATDKHGFQDDAIKLYREVVQKHPGTSFANQAEVRIKALSQK